MLQPGLVLISSYLISSIFYYPLANHNCLKIVTTSLHISCCDSFFLCVKNSPINLCGFFKKNTCKKPRPLHIALRRLFPPFCFSWVRNSDS